MCIIYEKIAICVFNICKYLHVLNLLNILWRWWAGLRVGFIMLFNHHVIIIFQPFWPTGSGLARGFLGALDAAWMLKHFCEGTQSPLELIEERETLFHLLPSTTPERLQKKTSGYTLNPHTRYPNLNLLVPPTNFSYLYDSDTSNSRIIKPADPALLPPTGISLVYDHKELDYVYYWLFYRT